MTLSAFLKPVLAVVVMAALGVGYYWFEHRSRPEEKETQSNALVIVAKSTNACFSDLVRVTGFIVPRREAVVGVDQEGSKVADVLVREGETVADNQELARVTPPPGQPRAAGVVARPSRGPRHRGENHCRRPGLAAGRADVPDFRQQRNRNRCRSAGNPRHETQSGRDSAHQPRRCAGPGGAGAAGVAPDRPLHPAWPCPDIPDQ